MMNLLLSINEYIIYVSFNVVPVSGQVPVPYCYYFIFLNPQEQSGS